ncbi:alternate-type signal peptide domain-containing protein [Cellulomonas sp. NPDC057328]|uniref:alternate-type signal peptide domain-containing protein n=1 Tax=Cellulomonas sp. NPDC057328 TaxID=3346101 RepID=UPI0036343FDB
MKNKTKGLIAGAAGIALLTGGSTFALWTASDSVAGGTITNGQLDVAALGDISWEDVSADRGDGPHDITLTSWQMVPGDTIEGTQDIDVALDGDNLVAELTLLNTGTEELAEGVSVQYDVVQGTTVLATAALGATAQLELQSADNPDAGRTEVGGSLNGTADLTVVVRVTFAANGTTSTLDTSVLNGLSIELDQIRA